MTSVDCTKKPCLWPTLKITRIVLRLPMQLAQLRRMLLRPLCFLMIILCSQWMIVSKTMICHRQSKTKASSLSRARIHPSCCSLRVNSAREMHLGSVRINQRKLKRRNLIIITRLLQLLTSLIATNLHSKLSSPRTVSKLTIISNLHKRDSQTGIINKTKTINHLSRHLVATRTLSQTSLRM